MNEIDYHLEICKTRARVKQDIRRLIGDKFDIVAEAKLDVLIDDALGDFDASPAAAALEDKDQK